MSDLLTPIHPSELSQTFNQPALRRDDGTLQKIILAQDWLEQFTGESASAPPNNIQAITTLLDEIARLQTELERSEAQRQSLEQMIDRDPMCPTLNHRAFERELTRAIALSQRSGQGGAVLFFDMNGLKSINDTYGHSAGDHAIQRLAKTIILTCRSTDLVGRLGGDEFAVLLPNTSAEGALVQGKRVARLLKTLPIWVEEGQTAVNLSTAYGTAAFDGFSHTQEVLNQADSAMYTHKKDKKPQ